MSKIVKVSGGDYRIEVQGALSPSTGLPTTGGNIILDTKSSGSTNGMVTIIGNLDVQGLTTNIESTNTTITDKIITLNNGQPGSGVGNGVVGFQESGIEIDRGSASKAQMLFSEAVSHWDTTTSAYVAGTFVLKTANGILSGLQVGALANDGVHDFAFDLQNQNPVLKVVNTTNYEARVTDPNHIPNKKFVNDYVAATGGIADVTNIHYPITGTPVISKVVADASGVTASIWNGTSSVAKWIVSTSGVTMGRILIADDTVQNISGTNNLILSSANSNIDLGGTINLVYQTDQLSPSGTANKVYSKATEGAGRTGIYFTSNNAYGAVAYNNDELVSKNRAVLLSILL